MLSGAVYKMVSLLRQAFQEANRWSVLCPVSIEVREKNSVGGQNSLRRRAPAVESHDVIPILEATFVIDYLTVGTYSKSTPGVRPMVRPPQT